MANTFAPNGFTPSRLFGGSPPNYQLETFPIAYNYGTQLGRGDPVELSSVFPIKMKVGRDANPGNLLASAIEMLVSLLLIPAVNVVPVRVDDGPIPKIG